ncbi:hypothetical protein FOA52_010336 [Chlamydomonas sp. UWO 241]|nr:hypothetical protein FOA52_010336 [Chlamydomonas sp. UWO 241]
MAACMPAVLQPDRWVHRSEVPPGFTSSPQATLSILWLSPDTRPAQEAAIRRLAAEKAAALMALPGGCVLIVSPEVVSGVAILVAVMHTGGGCAGGVNAAAGAAAGRHAAPISTS